MAAALQDSEEDNYAQESPQTRRAREKLRKRLEAAEKKVTSQALKESSHDIHRWISRHARARVTLKEKNICLFDENQNAAGISKKVSVFAKKIKENA